MEGFHTDCFNAVDKYEHNSGEIVYYNGAVSNNRSDKCVSKANSLLDNIKLEINLCVGRANGRCFEDIKERVRKLLTFGLPIGRERGKRRKNKTISYYLKLPYKHMESILVVVFIWTVLRP